MIFVSEQTSLSLSKSFLEIKNDFKIMQSRG